MSKITKLDRTALQKLRDPINAHLKVLADQLGLSMVLGNGSFGDGAEASFKLVLKVDDPETKLASFKAEHDRNCQFVGIDWNDPENTGLRPEDFGTEFQYGATTYRMMGIYTKGKNHTKFPIRAEVVADPSKRLEVGKLMMLPDSVVKTIRAATDAKAQPANGNGKKGRKAA